MLNDNADAEAFYVTISRLVATTEIEITCPQVMKIDLNQRMRSPVQRKLYQLMSPLLHKALGFDALESLYEKARLLNERHPQRGTLHGWLDASLAAIGHSYQVTAASGLDVPNEGPLVIVANHPFGLLDPLVLGHFISQHRKDLKIMANSMLEGIEELRPHLIQVNPFGTPGAARENIGGMKEAIRHLKQGGALLIFPSGEVAHYRPGAGVHESAWSHHVGALVRRTSATVLPVFIPGSNSMIFHASGLLSKGLRTGLIVREFIEAKSRRTLVQVGAPLPFAKLKRIENDVSLTMHLRINTLMLGERLRRSVGVNDPSTDLEPVLAGTDARLMSMEIERLKSKGKELASQGALSAFVAEAIEIPHLLHELGRLREVTFRSSGEGTGTCIDLDRFDRHYLHIFLWDEQKQRVAGAYRLGLADQIIRQHGARGLYTNTLFKFRKPFLRHLADAVEMGRSFVTAEYQRNMSALPLLWRAVIVWMGRNPRYRKLFGPVSISKDYDAHSQRLLVDFLKQHHGDKSLDGMVAPRKPFKTRKSRGLMRELVSLRLSDAEDCSALISSIETDGKGIPVLLKHYLRLNGSILSFNVDAAFSNVLDGLIMVDMLKTDPRLPSKMMGANAWAAYLAHHGVQS